MINLVSMTEEAFQEWLADFTISYGREHTKTGRWPVEGASDLARDEIQKVLPEGLSTNNHYLYSLVEEDLHVSVGMLWFTLVHQYGLCFAIVYNVAVDDQFRRRGYASQAFTLMEQKISKLGATKISLHVFANNYAARALYEKFGYGITNVNMTKILKPRE